MRRVIMQTMEREVVLSDNHLTIEELVEVARFHHNLGLSESVKKKIIKGRQLIDQFVKEERVIYGITTGVGENSTISISTADAKELQRNIIASHACGVGEPMPTEMVRAIMVMMIKNLSLGYSGIRLETVSALVDLLNKNITPMVPREGSVGYLNHQAHISLVILGAGEAYYEGELYSGKDALKKVGLKPIELYEKEGLSLINGTVDMTGLGALAIYDAENILKNADIASMISFEALRGTRYAFDPKIGEVKPHPGQIKSINNIQKLIDDSEIAEKFKEYRTQDALSIRSIPQVHGACKDVVRHVREVIEREMNSATDNPLVFAEDGANRSISSSNCHGEAVAMALDYLAISLTEISSIAERRTFRLVSPQYSGHAAFLVENSGLNSGYMIPQYIAASLVSDNKIFSHPASVDSIVTSAGQEDHVSMGTSAALKALKIIDNTRRVVSIEFMCGCQAVEFLQPLKQGKGTEAAYHLLREHVPRLINDRVLSEDIKTTEQLLRTGEVIKRVEEVVGQLEV